MQTVRLLMPVLAAIALLCATSGGAGASTPLRINGSGGKLLLTGGVTEFEGAAGGGLTPWSLIGGYGTRDQIGGNAFRTRLDLPDYRLDADGVMIGLFNRVELSLARQRFDTEEVGQALGLGRGFTLEQRVIGVKLRLFGDAILDQDSWVPQLALGVQHKRNNRKAVLKSIGARKAQGTDLYLSASKLYLAHSLLASVTLRYTRANQAGLLGFGGDRHAHASPQLETSLAWLLSRHLAFGAEYRMKPDNLGIAPENDWYDLFLAWAPDKHVSLTLAWAELGTIVIRDHQRGLYASVQVGF